MRISELASLRWMDIDLASNLIMLTDETAAVVRRRGRQARQIKNRRGRSFPIHQDLKWVLESIERQPEAQRQMQRVNFVGDSATKGVAEGTTPTL